MTKSYRRPYEEVLAGYYTYGSESYIVMDRDIRHKDFTAIHERTHLNLGTSTNTGLFQRFLQYLLSRRPYLKFPEFVRSMFTCSCDHSRDPHEAAATYHEFCSAQHNSYIGLPEMERDLPDEYRRWRKIFDDFFPESMPLDARGTAGYHLARFALNTTILVDYCEISYDKILDFDKYMAISNQSPNQRLTKILTAIDRYGKASFFGDYVAFYMDVSDTLKNAYRNRTLENRQVSFGIQSRILEIMSEAAVKLATYEPIFKEESVIGTPVPPANALVQKWKTFLRQEGYVDTLDFHFVDTDDGADVDILDEYEVLVTKQSPQPNLNPLEGKEVTLPQGSCLARIWAWYSEEPFVLCERPYRVLKKGDIYIRLIPFTDFAEAYFTVTSQCKDVERILSSCADSIVLDGDTYSSISVDCRLREGRLPVLVLWQSVNNFRKRVEQLPIVSYCYFHLKAGDVFLILVNGGDAVYHCFFAINDQKISLLLDLISQGLTRVDFMPYPKNLEPTLVTLNALFQFLA